MKYRIEIDGEINIYIIANSKFFLPVIVCRMERIIEKRDAKFKSLHELMQHDHLFKVSI